MPKEKQIACYAALICKVMDLDCWPACRRHLSCFRLQQGWATVVARKQPNECASTKSTLSSDLGKSSALPRLWDCCHTTSVVSHAQKCAD